MTDSEVFTKRTDVDFDVEKRQVGECTLPEPNCICGVGCAQFSSLLSKQRSDCSMQVPERSAFRLVDLYYSRIVHSLDWH